MSLSKPRCAPPKTDCNHCGCGTPGGCDCAANLALATPVAQIAGLGTAYGLFTAAYCGLLSHSGETCNANYGLGHNFLVGDLAYYTTDNGDLGFILSPDCQYWFTPVEGSMFVAHFGSLAKLSQTGGVYTLAEPDGTEYVFSSASQLLLRKITPGGQKTENVFDGDRLLETRRSFPALSPTTTEVRKFDYVSGGAGATLIGAVTLGNARSPASPFRRMVFTYYGENDPSGNLNDLRTVEEQVWRDGVWVSLGIRLFRYYKPGDPNGAAHLLKFDLSPEGYARLAKFIDPLVASDDEVVPFADFFYKYTPDTRRLKEIRRAGGTLIYYVTYVENLNCGYAPGYNIWKTKVTVQHPNGYLRVVYCNHIQKEILNVYKHPDPPIFWGNFTQFIEGVPIGMEANNAKPYRMVKPAGITGYHETGTTPFLQVDLVAANSNKCAFDVLKYGDNTTGKPAGYVIEEGLTNGDESPSAAVATVKREWELITVGGTLGTLIQPSSITEIPDPADSAKNITTTFAHTVHTGTAQIATRTTTPPVIPTAQNGDGVPYTIIETFDIQGRNTATTDERLIVTQNVFDDVTGARLKTTADVGTGRLNLVTDFRVDDLGRTILSLAPLRSAENGNSSAENGYNGQPVREAQFTVYKDADHEVWSASGYATGVNHGPEYDFTLTNPVSIQKMDKNGRTIDQISAVRADTSGPLSAGDSFPQSTWVRWTRMIHDDAGYFIATRTYHNIPAEGEGLPGVHYEETRQAYDIMGRPNKNVAAEGTITRKVFDPRGLTLSIYVGTNDAGATEENPAGPTPPSPTIANSNNMRAVVNNLYDGGLPGGNGLLTETEKPVDANSANNRRTRFLHDFRDRRIKTTFILDATHQFEITAEHDNLDRVTAREKFKVVSSTPTRIGRREMLHDKRNHIFRTIVWAITPAIPSPVPTNALYSDRWFDQSGNLVCDKPAGSDLFTKTQLDALGRPIMSYAGYYNQDYLYDAPPLIPYSAIYDADDNEINVSADIIIEQTETLFDEASNSTRTTFKRRRDDANPATTGKLETDTVEPTARTTYSDVWSDGSGRTIAAANYGTTEFPATRSSIVPESTDTLLVSLTRYNDRGEAFESVDPTGKVTHTVSDDMGRDIRSIDNYRPECSPHAPHEVSPSPSPTAGPFNVTVEKTYFVRDLVATLTAVNAVTGNQVTRYEYGTTLETSLIARNDLLVEEIYPDAADATDHVFHTYNQQAERKSTADQNGTLHLYTRDRLGRLTADTIALFGPGIDTAVNAIAQEFDDRGLLFHVKSLSGATVLNDAQFDYNNFMQLTTEHQEHSGAVIPGTSVKVGYEYAAGSADGGRTNNTIRRTGITYPTARITPPTLAYNFGTSGGINDKLSRVRQLDFAGTSALAQYDYLGLNGFVRVTYPEPAIRYSLISGGGALRYGGLDSFDRIVDCLWETTAGTPTSKAQLKYGYDRASNRTFRRDQAAHDAGKKFDEFYTHDGLHRLKSAGRGELVSDNTRLDSTNFAQAWELDPTGNWSGFNELVTRSVSEGLEVSVTNQTRTSNAANEITAIDAVSGPVWKQPGYDRAGNMTTIPQPKSPPDGFKAEYDAWNRLVRLRDAATNALVHENIFDGLRRWIATEPYPGETRHHYFSDSWQVLEERVGDDPHTAVVDRQLLWGARYIDDLVLRDRSASGGTFNERLYAIQDANWNVVAICNTSGTIQERYAYSPYGVPLFLSASFVIQASHFDFETLFCGYRYDATTGLYSVRFRALHSVLGSWLTTDPVGYAAGDVNLLRYVRNTPLVLRDSLGLMDLNFVPFAVEPFAGFTGQLSTSPDWDYSIGDHYGKKESHGQRACRITDFCFELILKLQAWITHAAIRTNELKVDKLNLLVKDPKGYNNHVQKLEEAHKHIFNCWDFIKLRCRCNDLREPKPFPVPRPIPIVQPLPGLTVEETAEFMKNQRNSAFDRNHPFGGGFFPIPLAPIGFAIGVSIAGTSAAVGSVVGGAAVFSTASVALGSYSTSTVVIGAPSVAAGAVRLAY